jgi:ATP/maltotriose-dependent transcriptional regulator MalT/DNA-binding SARP family transcriptional activator
MGSDEAIAGILKTKLYAPRLPDIIPREKLLQKLNAAKKTKLTTIVAGAGYGKSTLAASFLADQKVPSVWYQLEETDRDLSEFITYLVAGVRMQESGFGEETSGRLKAAEDAAGESRVILATLISEMDARVKNDLIIVLDDFQEVNNSSQVTEALDFLLGHMPPNLHLVILSRIKLNLDLASLAARRQLVEIKEADLGLSSIEIAQLFSEVFGMPLEDEETSSLCEYTEGWITGLVLFWLAARDRGEDFLKEVLTDLKVPPARVGEYLSGVVFESQSEKVREFTMKTSLLTRLNPEFCDQLLESEESGLILDHLANSRMFTIPLDDRGDWYRYHHLLQAFLKERLTAGCSHEEINGLNLKAAILWEEYGEPEQALHHYLEAGEHGKAAGVLEGIAPGLRKASRISFLPFVLNRLPQETLEEHPWLLFHLGEISYLHGDYERAAADFERAASLFEQSVDVGAQASALIWLSSSQYQLAWLDEYEDTAAKLREIIPVGSPQWYEFAATLSSTAFFTGSYDLADRFLTEALEHAHEVEDETSRATLLYFCGLTCFAKGDAVRACEVLYQVVELAERVDLTTTLMQSYAVLCNCLAMSGEFEDMLEYADKGVALAEQIGHDTPLTFLLYACKAAALTYMGNTEEARRETDAASSMSGKYGAGLEVLLAEFDLGHQYMVHGESDLALRHYRIAQQMGREVAYPDSMRATRLGELWANHGEEGIEATIEEAETIARQLEQSSSDEIVVYAYLVLAFLELTAGRSEEAQHTIQAALELTEGGRGLGFWRIVWGDKKASGMLLPLVTETFSRGEYLEVLGKIYQYLGSSSLPYLNKLSRSKKPQVRKKAGELAASIARESAEPLTIRMLGTFEITRGRERISARDWRSKKALAVMKYLAAQEDRRLVPRDILMDLLWPESAPESASKNLGTALSSLRKTLEPETARGESSYLVASGDSLYLELGRGGRTDFKLFRLKIREAGDARASGDDDLYLERLKEAEDLYGGDFLAEDLYEDWCQPERESLHAEHLKLLLDISDEYLRRGDQDQAVHYLEKAVASDPDREELYRRLMEIYSSTGNRAGVERTFKRCSKYLMDEFEVDPSPDTVELHNRLRGN